MRNVRCPDTPHDIIGCGTTFVTDLDDENLADCPNCGMFFDPDAADCQPQPEAAR